MERKNILFVCSQGEQRSPAAMELVNGRGKHEAKAVGISPFAETRISSEAVEWADVIICMEDMHKRYVLDNFADEVKDKEIRVLEIPDVYMKGESELNKLLKPGLREFL